MAYKFQLGDTLMSGSLYQTGSFKILDDDGSLMVDIARDTGNFDTTGTITCDDSITIDSITITDTELGYLDGLTLGTVAVNKVVTVDGSKNVATLGTVGCGAITSTGASSYGTLTGGNLSGSGTLQIVGNAFLGGTLNVTGNADFDGTISCDTSITIDSTTISAAEIGLIDGVTAGTVAASKAVTVDSNLDCSGYRNISGSGTLQAVGNAFLGATLKVTGAVTLASTLAAGGNITTTNGFVSGSAALKGLALIIENNTIIDKNRNVKVNIISGSGTLQAVGNAFLGAALSVSGNVTLGDTSADVTTNTGRLTASQGAYFAGRVGFGTATPARGIHLYGAGTQRIQVESSDNQAGIELKSDSTDGVIIYSPNASDGLSFNIGGTTVVEFGAGGTVSGSGTLQAVGNAFLGGTLNVTGNLTATGDTNTFTSVNANDPLVIIKNTTNDTDGARLRFVKDKGAAGADNDVVGVIEFYGDDDAQAQTLFGRIQAEIADASNSAEGGKLVFGVATHDGEMQTGLLIADGDAEDEIDVTIGNGPASLTTIAGDLDIPNGGFALGSDASGDMYYRNSSGVLTRIAAGDDDQILTLDGAVPGWEAAGGGGRTVAGDTDNGIITWVTSDNTFAAEANLTYTSDDLTAVSSTASKPVLTLKNTNNGATSAYLKFINDKGAAGADDDVCGTITFYGDDDNQDNLEFARIEGIVSDASNGAEGGALKLWVATHDGEMQTGLLLQDGSAEDEIDVTIGSGPASATTIAGDLKTTSGARYINIAAVPKTTTYTVAAQDEFVSCNTVGGAFTVTLPASSDGRLITIKDGAGYATGSNTITVDGNGSEKIDGETTQIISNGWGSVTMVGSGSAWYII